MWGGDGVVWGGGDGGGVVTGRSHFCLALPRKATIRLMKELLAQLIHGTALTCAQAESAFTDIMEGTGSAAG